MKVRGRSCAASCVEHCPKTETDGYLWFASRAHRKRGQFVEAQEIFNRLTNRNRKGMNQLICNIWLVDCFDLLIPYEGLWDAFALSSIPKILSWKSREEVENYILKVHKMWNEVLDGNGALLDTGTAGLVTCLCPKHSASDRAQLQSLVEQGKLFPQVARELRDGLIDRLSSQEIVLTLESFFGHVKVLEVIVHSLRTLLPEPSSERAKIQSHLSLRQSITELYVSPTDEQPYPIQVSRAGFRAADVPLDLRPVFTYLQLCLYGYRHFPQLTKCTPRTPAGKRKGSGFKEHAGAHLALQCFGWLALRLSASSVEIAALTAEPPELPVQRTALQQLRPESLYATQSVHINSEVMRQYDFIQGVQSLDISPEKATWTTHSRDTLQRDRRNRPSDADFAADSRFMFCHNLYVDQSGHYITAFAVQVLVIRCFYSDLLELLNSYMDAVSSNSMPSMRGSSPSGSGLGAHGDVSVEDLPEDEAHAATTIHPEVIGTPATQHSTAPGIRDIPGSPTAHEETAMTGDLATAVYSVCTQLSQDEICLYRLKDRTHSVISRTRFTSVIKTIARTKRFLDTRLEKRQVYALYNNNSRGLNTFSPINEVLFKTLWQSIYRNTVFMLDEVSNTEEESVLHRWDGLLQRGRKRKSLSEQLDIQSTQNRDFSGRNRLHKRPRRGVSEGL